MVWGDSHAASLYRGLNYQAETVSFNLAQYTVGGCPPIVDSTANISKECREINQFVLSRIEALRPHTVILAAYWSRYDSTGDGSDEPDYLKLKSTIRALQNRSIRNIVLVGHLPTFEVNQPKVGAKVFVANKVDRTYRNFNSISAKIDSEIEVFARENGVAFVSPIGLLCNQDGCMISASSNELVPLAWDYGHLTDAGSTLLIGMALQQRKLHLPTE
jgi:hypothetical protein